ncbi:MAG: UDP-N-acetylglucosamine-1-phosphate transferase [Nitrosopumilus sp. H13]|nr:MAG: UDP-N-acetylglucosamine-1-phosphate transferase [Nitrosopumilus sp. H13]
MTELLHVILSCATAFGVVYAATPLLARFLESRGMTVPDGHKRKKIMVAMPGGPALIAGVIASELVLYMFAPSVMILSVLITTVAAFAIGLADDRRSMSGWFKPVALAAAAVPILLLGAYDTDLAFPIFGDVHIPVLYVGLVIFMIIITGNTANSIDVLNGVLSGFMGIAGLVLAVCLVIVNNYEVAAAALPLAAVSFAYYKYHRLQSRIFPGDSGALTLGAMYGALAIVGGVEVIAAVIILPAILNSFLFLSSTRRIVEFRKTPVPVVMTDEEDVRLRSTNDRLAPVTLVRLILAAGPLSESQVARRIFCLGLFSGALGIITAAMTGANP